MVIRSNVLINILIWQENVYLVKKKDYIDRNIYIIINDINELLTFDFIRVLSNLVKSMPT